MREAIKGTVSAHHALMWRAAAAFCVLAVIILGVLAAQHRLVRSAPSAVDRNAGQNESALMATGNMAVSASAEAGGVSSPCDSCDGRHRHILRLREAAP